MGDFEGAKLRAGSSHGPAVQVSYLHEMAAGLARDYRHLIN